MPGKRYLPLKEKGITIEDRIKALSFALEGYLEAMKHEILQAIRENEQTLEVLARELARRRKSK
jgi:hypothetical protein